MRKRRTRSSPAATCSASPAGRTRHALAIWRSVTCATRCRRSPDVTLALGTAYFQAGALGEAEQELLAVLRQDPSSGDAENNLAVLYASTGRLDEAEAALQRA